MYHGKSIRVSAIGEGFIELCFDRTGEAINKFDTCTVSELKEAIGLIAATPSVRGVLATSAKDGFIAGADIREFEEKFRLPHADLVEDVRLSGEVFVALEDLDVPTVAAISGYALGGGFEFALACSLRVMARRAQVGFPEVKLGLIPGFGGTVRLPRVVGARTAVEWIVDGNPRGADAAVAAGAVDQAWAPERVRTAALELLRDAAGGALDWREPQQRKRRPDESSAEGRLAAFTEWRHSLAGEKSLQQPAALAAVELMARTAMLERDAALALESEAFARVAHTQAASALVHAFLAERDVKKIAQQRAWAAPPAAHVLVETAAEGLEATRNAVAEIEATAPAHTVIATSTSSLRIDHIATALKRPEGLVGIHFLASATSLPLVEVVRGARSSEEAVAAAIAHVLALKKTPVVVKDGPGFLVNRVLAAYFAAARQLVANDAAGAALDQAMVRFGWRMGPFQLQEWIGIETCRRVAGTICPPHPERLPRTPPTPGHTDAEFVERLMLPFVVEAARALEEGVVATAAELDFALLHAAGCPAHVGGPLRYADWLGLREVVRRCDALRTNGLIYEPTPRMRQLAARGGCFHGSGL